MEEPVRLIPRSSLLLLTWGRGRGREGGTSSTVVGDEQILMMTRWHWRQEKVRLPKGGRAFLLQALVCVTVAEKSRRSSILLVVVIFYAYSHRKPPAEHELLAVAAGEILMSSPITMNKQLICMYYMIPAGPETS